MRTSSASNPADIRKESSRDIGAWLLICCAMIFVMIVLGGVTRLTHSGLSMVEWKPLTGILPPMSESAWEETFRKYQAYPEFREQNSDMSLAGFKSIFWLEYIHRLWGRSIGLVFLLPFLYFLLRGRLDKVLLIKLGGLFLLGGLQGLLGWYMVKSGLVDRPDVSPYRLTAHLGLAFLVYALIFLVALGQLIPRERMKEFPDTGKFPMSSLGLSVFVFVTVLSGGFVAGTDAGFAYNTFPLMGGRLIPEGLFMLDPLVRNFFENIITVQFDHRLLATLLLGCVLLFWLIMLRAEISSRARLALHCRAITVVAQVVLGISTLIMVVPVSLAALHQANAVLLFTASLWVFYELR